MMRLLLGPQVHFCQRADAFVFLDLRRDDYNIIEGRAAAALRTVSLDPENCSPVTWSALQELIRGGLLTTDAGIGRPLLPVRTVQAMEALLDSENPLAVRITMSHVLSFTIVGRALCHSETSGDCRLEQLRQVNEIQHRVLSYIGHALDAIEDVVWIKPVLAFVFEAEDAAVRSEPKRAWRHAMHSVNPTRESEAT